MAEKNLKLLNKIAYYIYLGIPKREDFEWWRQRIRERRALRWYQKRRILIDEWTDELIEESPFISRSIGAFHMKEHRRALAETRRRFNLDETWEPK